MRLNNNRTHTRYKNILVHDKSIQAKYMIQSTNTYDIRPHDRCWCKVMKKKTTHYKILKKIKECQKREDRKNVQCIFKWRMSKLLCLCAPLCVDCWVRASEWASPCARDSGEIKCDVMYCLSLALGVFKTSFSFCFIFPLTLIKRYTQETQIILNSVVVCVSLQCDDDDDLYLGYTQSIHTSRKYSHSRFYFI